MYTWEITNLSTGEIHTPLKRKYRSGRTAIKGVLRYVRNEIDRDHDVSVVIKDSEGMEISGVKDCQASVLGEMVLIGPSNPVRGRSSEVTGQCPTEAPPEEFREIEEEA